MLKNHNQQQLLKDMFEAGVHFGHQTQFWNPKMLPFIYQPDSLRNKKIHIINLDKTVTKFNEALNFIYNIVKNRGEILLIGTRSQAREIIAEEANRAQMPFVDHRWLGGMLTNFDTVKKSIKKLEQKRALLEKSDNGLSKKELLDLTREVNKLESSIGGIKNMKKIPDALFIIDTGCHEIAIKEAKKLGIPVVGIVDTNNDPSIVDYVVPGNDDSAKAIRLYVSMIADTIIAARESAVQELANTVRMEIIDDNDQPKQGKVHRVKKTSADDEKLNEVNKDLKPQE